MGLSVAWSAQGDEIFLRIIPEQTSRTNMMDLKVTRRTTVLATPSISLEHPFPQLPVRPLIEPQPRLFSPRKACHIFVFSMNSFLLRGGSRAKSRCNETTSASGSPVSRFAPARKSAQIISSI